MAANYKKILDIYATILLYLILFYEKAFSSSKTATELVYLKTLDHTSFINDIFVVVYLMCLISPAVSKLQRDYKWEYLKKCDVLRFLQSQEIYVFCLDDYTQDVHDDSLSRHELMRHEWARFVSFNTFPQVAHSPSALRLANNGFYYTEEGTIVACFCCRQRFDATTEENVGVAQSHHSETCAFASGNRSSNVPISDESVVNRSHSDSDTESSNGTRQSFIEVQQSRPSPNQYLRRTDLVTSSQLLANAGFRQDGNDEYLKCFVCGLRLNRSLLACDPWNIHALLSPRCGHVRRIKGNDFVRQVHSTVVEVHNSIQATEETDSLENDLQRPEIQRVLQQGYESSRVRNAVIHLRRRLGRQALSAKNIIDYLRTTEPNLVDSTTANEIPAALKQFVKASKEKSQDEKEIADLNAMLRQHKEEIIELKREKLCKVCLENDICIVFLPCGHLVACSDCALCLRKCPVCRVVIKGTVRTYMS